MDQSIRLGTVDDVPVGVHWSVLAIFFLVAWELSDLVLPADRPHQRVGTYWAAGLAATALFFASLLAHEVAHAVVAKRNGVGVRRITLWLFGGVSELESDALTPGADFRIAVVGPVTSLFLGALFGVLALTLRSDVGAAGVVATALGWLAWMNLLLGAFNLMPAAPLDGGRVLRALLWHRTGDRLRAAMVATRTGQIFGYVLVGLGILEFMAAGLIGLWFVFLGWFLLSAARAEETDTVLRSSLADVLVRDIMTGRPTTFPATGTVADLLDHQLHRHRFGSYPLTAPDGTVVGLTTLGRIRLVPPAVRASTRLIDTGLPIADIPLATPDEPVPGLLQRMQASPDGRALVLGPDGHLVGIVSPSDISRFVQLSMLQAGGHGGSGRTRGAASAAG
jgi:Zn-dependent protease/CBS domain-containing protein